MEEYKYRSLKPTLFNRTYVKSRGFRIPSRSTKPRSEIVQEICLQKGYTLVTKKELNKLCILAKDNRYRNIEAQYVQWDGIKLVFNYYTELNDILNLRLVCKEVLYYVDSGLPERWQKVVDTHVPYREISIEKLRSFKPYYIEEFIRYYSSCFYSSRIGMYTSSLGEFTYHIIHHNLEAIKKMKYIPKGINSPLTRKSIPEDWSDILIAYNKDPDFIRDVVYYLARNEDEPITDKSQEYHMPLIHLLGFASFVAIAYDCYHRI
jgi:hypothetical protein